MRGIFALSYVLLWGLIIIEAVVLREVLRKTIRFKQTLRNTSQRTVEEISWLHTGTPVPDFTAPLLGTGESLTTSQLRGEPGILLFVNAEESSPFYEKLATAIHGMWHKAEGRIYLICNGTPEACRQFARKHSVDEVADKIPVVLDENGRIAESFRINETPQAVELDEYLRVKRYGRPSPSHDSTTAQSTNGDRRGETSEPFNSQSNVDETTTPPLKSEIRQAEIGSGNNGNSEEPCDWPDDLPSSGASFARVNTTVSCVMTRFRLRSAWSMIPFYLAFRRVRRDAHNVAGLLNASFLIEDLHTCYTMSLWKDDCAIVEFGSVQAHVAAANSAFGPTWRKDLKRPEIWSAQFRLWAVSAHNLNWEELDLQTVLADQWQNRKKVAQQFLEKDVAHVR